MQKRIQEIMIRMDELEEEIDNKYYDIIELEDDKREFESERNSLREDLQDLTEDWSEEEYEEVADYINS